MDLSVAINRGRKASKMLAFFAEQEAAGFPAWSPEAVAAGREQFRKSGAEAAATLVVHYGWTDDMLREHVAYTGGTQQ